MTPTENARRLGAEDRARDERLRPYHDAYARAARRCSDARSREEWERLYALALAADRALADAMTREAMRAGPCARSTRRAR